MSVSKRKAVSSKRSDAPPGAGRGTVAGLDIEAVRELAQIVNEFDLSEVEVDPTGRIRVARRKEVAVAGGALPGPSALSLMPAPEKAEEQGSTITSPFVGTFYRSPNPESPVFVEVGGQVRKGQVVCIVEAMKLMNEIESELDGKVLEVLVANGAHVEYGQPLFRLGKP